MGIEANEKSLDTLRQDFAADFGINLEIWQQLTEQARTFWPHYKELLSHFLPHGLSLTVEADKSLLLDPHLVDGNREAIEVLDFLTGEEGLPNLRSLNTCLLHLPKEYTDEMVSLTDAVANLHLLVFGMTKQPDGIYSGNNISRSSKRKKNSRLHPKGDVLLNRLIACPFLWNYYLDISKILHSESENRLFEKEHLCRNQVVKTKSDILMDAEVLFKYSKTSFLKNKLSGAEQDLDRQFSLGGLFDSSQFPFLHSAWFIKGLFRNFEVATPLHLTFGAVHSFSKIVKANPDKFVPGSPGEAFLTEAWMQFGALEMPSDLRRLLNSPRKNSLAFPDDRKQVAARVQEVTTKNREKPKLSEDRKKRLAEELGVDLSDIQKDQEVAVKNLERFNMLDFVETVNSNIQKEVQRKLANKVPGFPVFLDLSGYSFLQQGTDLERFFKRSPDLRDFSEAVFYLPDDFELGVSHNEFHGIVSDIGAMLRSYVYDESKGQFISCGEDSSRLLADAGFRMKNASFLMFVDYAMKDMSISVHSIESLLEITEKMTDANLFFFLLLCPLEYQSHPHFRERIVSIISKMILMPFFGASFNTHLLLCQPYARNMLSLWVEAHKQMLADKPSVAGQLFSNFGEDVFSLPKELSDVIETARPFPQPEIEWGTLPFEFRLKNFVELNTVVNRRGIFDLYVGVRINGSAANVKSLSSDGFYSLVDNEVLVPGMVHQLVFYCLAGDDMKNPLIPLSQTAPMEIRVPFPRLEVGLMNGDPFRRKILNFDAIKKAARGRTLQLSASLNGVSQILMVASDGTFDLSLFDFPPGRAYSVLLQLNISGQDGPGDLFPQVRLPDFEIPFLAPDIQQEGRDVYFRLANWDAVQELVAEGSPAVHLWGRRKAQERNLVTVADDGTFSLENLPVGTYDLFFRFAEKAHDSLGLFPEIAFSVEIEHSLPEPVIRHKGEGNLFWIDNLGEAERTSSQRKRVSLLVSINGKAPFVLVVDKKHQVRLPSSLFDLGENSLVFHFSRNGDRSSETPPFLLSMEENLEPLGFEKKDDPSPEPETSTSLEAILEAELSGLDLKDSGFDYSVNTDGEIVVSFDVPFWQSITEYWELEHNEVSPDIEKYRNGIILSDAFLDAVAHDGLCLELKKRRAFIRKKLVVERQAEERSAQMKEIEDWKKRSPDLFERVRQARRIFDRFAGQWKTSRGGKKDYHWRHMVRALEGNAEFKGEINHLYRLFREAGILFTPPTVGKKSSFNGIERFQIETPHGSVEGKVEHLSGDALQVVLSEEVQLPSHWEYEVRELAAATFITFVEITSRYGTFRPRLEYEKRKKEESDVDTKPPTQNELRDTIKRIFGDRCRIPVFKGLGDNRVLVDEQEVSLESFLLMDNEAEVLTRGNNTIIVDLREVQSHEVKGEISITGDRIHEEEAQDKMDKKYDILLACVANNPYLKKYLLERLVTACAKARGLPSPSDKKKLPEIARQRSEAILIAFGITPEAVAHRQVTVEDLLALPSSDGQDLVERMIVAWREIEKIQKGCTQIYEQVSVWHSKPKLLPVTILKAFVQQIRSEVERDGFSFKSLDVSRLSQQIKGLKN